MTEQPTQQLINAQKDLDNRRKRAGVDAPLSTDSPKPATSIADPLPLARGDAQVMHPASITPQERPTAARMPQEQHELPDTCYLQWRGLKEQIGALQNKHGVLNALKTQQGREIVKNIAALETAHDAELQQWRQWATQDLHQRLKEQSENEARKIRLFGRMMTRAQLLKHELSFRLWAVVRYTADGDNNVLVETIRHTFSDGGQHAFTSWPNLRKQINQAVDRGYFHYSKDKTRLYFASERRVAVEVLGLDAVGGWALGFTIEELTRPFVRNRAIFHAAFHGSRGDGFNNPISRRSIQRETGRGKRTQRKYEQLAEVKTEANYELIGDDTSDDPTLRRVYVDGDSQLVKDLPNSYAASLPTVKRGRRWLNQRITHLCKQFSDDGHNPPVLVMGSCNHAIKQKRYFPKPPQVDTNTVRFYPLAGDTRLWSRVC